MLPLKAGGLVWFVLIVLLRCLSGADGIFCTPVVITVCVPVYCLLCSRVLPANRNKRTSVTGWFLLVDNFRPRCNTMWMRPVVADGVAWSVCLSVSVMSPAKTAGGYHAYCLYRRLVTCRHSVAKWGGIFQQCLSVCLFVRTITYEQLNVGWRNLAIRCIVQRSRPGSNLGVKARIHQGQKTKKCRIFSGVVLWGAILCDTLARLHWWENQCMLPSFSLNLMT